MKENDTFFIRDLHCAGSVAEMAKLDRFDKEFAVYGTAGYAADGNLYYHASTNEQKLYQYIQEQMLDGYYFTPISYLIKWGAVPKGMEDDYMQIVKYYLLSEMKRDYESVNYFEIMHPIFCTEPNNSSYELLKEYSEQIEGYFNECSLQLFMGAIITAYEGKVLTSKSYREFNQYYRKVQKQIENDPVPAGQIKRTLYGFGYLDKGEIKYIMNALPMEVVKQRDKKIMSGVLAAPIIKKTFWMSSINEVNRIRKEFLEYLIMGQNEAYFILLTQLKNLPGVINTHILNDIREIFSVSQKAMGHLNYYMNTWNKMQ